MPWCAADHRELVARALSELGVARLLFAIHDASFPSDPDEDTGAGSPGTRAADRLLELVRALGFTGVQLGPAGETSRENPSPYDGAAFSRAIALIPKAVFEPEGMFAGLIDARALESVRGDGGDRGEHRRAHDVAHALAVRAWAAFEGGARPDLGESLARFRTAHAAWLERDALYAALAAAGESREPSPWQDEAPARVARRARLVHRHARELEAYAFGQLLAHAAHERLRVRARALGLELYADLQVGYAAADVWGHASAFLPGYVMGAPPSRTNPEGQPWGYAVLDPAQRGPGGAARALVRARADKLFAEYDGVRIDHPHGLVCPWVYRADAADPAVAVRAGARLFEAPDRRDHPVLARYAIVAPDQLDRSLPDHADGFVRALASAQVDRYAVLFDEIVAAAVRHGRSPADLSCEVLSTLPRPLERVLGRHGLGRWRVLQKADLADPRDVYRPENAVGPDWVMLGNHDTPAVFDLIARWDAERRAAWSHHLARRLALPEGAAADLAAAPGKLASSMLAELFACRAANVMVFFPDLFGCEERFNQPGTVSEVNWRLRLPSDFATRYRERLARGRALNLPFALALALRAQKRAPELSARLAALAAAAGTTLPGAAGAG